MEHDSRREILKKAQRSALFYKHDEIAPAHLLSGLLGDLLSPNSDYPQLQDFPRMANLIVYDHSMLLMPYMGFEQYTFE